MTAVNSSFVCVTGKGQQWAQKTPLGIVLVNAVQCKEFPLRKSNSIYGHRYDIV
jgi:hypothetical protein